MGAAAALVLVHVTGAPEPPVRALAHKLAEALVLTEACTKSKLCPELT